MAGPAAETADDTAETVVRLGAVTKRYRSGVLALGPLDLTVRRGEFIALVGPSGCGKSTALRLIAGLAEPSSGTLQIAPRTAGRSGPGHAIGVVFQEPTLMPWASVRGNVGLPLKLGHLARADIEARVMRVLAQVGLRDFAGAMPRELSGGMKMRAALARALVTDPDILLLDEPFAALDEITRFRLNNDLLALWRDLGKTVIFVTHSVYESVYLAQRVLVMTPRPGTIAAEFDIVGSEPRDESFRMSADYAAQCRAVAAALARTADPTEGR